jgi:plasmid rolling circle replication initiator protein Rep
MPFLNERELIESNAQLGATLRTSPLAHHQNLSVKLIACHSESLVTDEVTGEVTVCHINCKSRACKRCMNIKQWRQERELKVWLPRLLRERSDLHFAFLSLGFPNVVVDDLPNQYEQITEGFARLIRRDNKAWPALGWVTGKEFTVKEDMRIHINTHSILALPSDYFTNSSKYLSHREWVSELNSKFKMPVNVDIRSFNSNARYQKVADE